MFARNPKMTKKKICSTVFFSGYVDCCFNITTKVLFKSFFLDVSLLYINFSITLTTFFVKMKKKLTQSLKKVVSSKFDFYHLFVKRLLWTHEMQFWQPCHNFSAKSWIFSLKDQTLSNN